MKLEIGLEIRRHHNLELSFSSLSIPVTCNLFSNYLDETQVFVRKEKSALAYQNNREIEREAGAQRLILIDLARQCNYL